MVTETLGLPFINDFYEYSSVSGSYAQVEHGYGLPRKTISNTYNFECEYCHDLYFDHPSECRGCGSQRFYDLSRRPLRDIVQRQ